MSDKVLSPAEVAAQRRRAEVTYEKTGSPTACEVDDLCDSHEALRAEITRLRGLIEGMGHESQCNAEWTYNADMGCRARRVTPQAEFCNCIQSKVNL